MAVSDSDSNSGKMEVDRSGTEHSQKGYSRADSSDHNGDDSSSEYEEEDFYIVATLPAGSIDQAKLTAGTQRSHSTEIDDTTAVPHYALIDVDTDRPLLELEGTVYQGVQDEVLGSTMLFSRVAGDDDDGDGDADSADAVLLGTTSRVISFHPVKFSKQ
ncbi:hypothetical protein H4S02_010595 [Coemansia sp. RSA 2611]|nr:hypothetical protein H4S01_005783 [Coemansia sp. RSA 2610]KAJ2365842.1 hypothetical protein H4S02_010595 [Coemansia sp. RSA 2611]